MIWTMLSLSISKMEEGARRKEEGARRRKRIGELKNEKVLEKIAGGRIVDHFGVVMLLLLLLGLIYEFYNILFGCGHFLGIENSR